MLWPRRSRRPVEPAPTEADPVAPAEMVDRIERVPSPAHMRRERRALTRRRETEIRDVGGLAVEMVRRDRFRPELLVRRATDVLEIEQRLHELDGLLMAIVAARRAGRPVHCRCGAPLLPGAHFCSHCGRPAPGTPPIATCRHCGQPLPAETNFCTFCGNSVAADELAAEQEDIDDTMVRPWSSGEGRAGDN